jgi:hypothetical protein
MKKLLLSTFLLLSNLACAQGNLQFNQVLLLSTSQNTTVLLGTVPAGKTWKIEGFGTELQGNNECNFSFNGSNVAFRSGSAFIYSGSYAYVGSTDHFWIPAGTPLYALTCNNFNGYRWVSIIEFNIIP